MAFLERIRLPAADAPETEADATILPFIAEKAHAGFTPIEWQIIGLARNDGLASLSEPGLLARLWRVVTGDRRDPRLADGRLEALRRLAVDAWHRGYNVRPSILSAFRAAGFSDGQFETLLTAISMGRHAPRSWSLA